MDISDWAALASAGFAGLAIRIAWLSNKKATEANAIAKRADERTAAYADAAFRVLAVRSTDAYTGIEFVNIGASVAKNVSVTLVDSFTGETFGDFSELAEDGRAQFVEPDRKVWLSASFGEAGRTDAWRKGFSNIQISWFTMADDPRHVILECPLVDYSEGIAFPARDD